MPGLLDQQEAEEADMDVGGRQNDMRGPIAAKAVGCINRSVSGKTGVAGKDCLGARGGRGG